MATNLPRWEQKLDSYDKALHRLALIVNESQKRQLNEFEVDCIVQRFEFTHETAWKLMKSYAEFQGTDEISGSRDATRWAFENRLIEDGQTWMNMIRSRNETSHMYDGEVSEAVIARVVSDYFPVMVAFRDKMFAKASNTPNDIFNQ